MEFGMNLWEGTCGNRGLIRLDDSNGLLVHSDFCYSDESGMRAQ